MTDHTPEPLAYEIVPFDNEERAKPYSEWTGLYIGPDNLEGGMSRTLFEGGFTHGPEDGDPEADAKRLVACWNACAGIPTERLKPGTVLEAINTLGWLNRQGGLGFDKHKRIEAALAPFKD